MSDIRFIDYRYRDLFKVKDGENIIITKMNGNDRILKCDYSDLTHTMIGNDVYHITQFAKHARNNSIIYGPENQREGEIYSVHEIYHIKNILATDYRFSEC